MRYLDVCAGISASTVAWRPLGWEAAAYSEIEAAPRAVLAHHYPNTPLHGDFTTIQGDEYGPIDLLVGGTPCQDFSIAGLRKGLAGERGNLSLEFLRLADRIGTRWLVWENVVGVLSIDGGRAFGAILGGLVELGYGFAYRVLDARYFGSAGQRARVILVACAGDWRAAAATLLERQSLGQMATPRLSRSDIHGCVSRGIGSRLNLDGSLTLIPDEHGYRFVSPVEAERIMGFPDDYTLVPFRNRMTSDRARYEMLGNSMHVGKMRWVGERIAAVEAITERLAA